MQADQVATARICLEGAETNSMTFPEIVGALMQSGFESYVVDFRLARTTYFLPAGEYIELETHRSDGPVGQGFDATSLKDAIREAQTLAPGYTYKGFCSKAKAAGCAGYIVSFLGRRALYFGRTAEVHVEHFP